MKKTIHTTNSDSPGDYRGKRNEKTKFNKNGDALGNEVE
jgi:hypothetical protein